ncbi:MAG: alpha/beta hydrolase [Peptococcaceae bacterium]|mgnify:FL=1|nr:alpha/beta hydrolase [Peptococcaceae bacterium]
MKRKTIILSGFLVATAVIFLLIVTSSFFIYNLVIMRQASQTFNNQQNVPLILETTAVNAFEENNNLSADFNLAAQDVFANEKWLENKFYESWSVISDDGLKLMGYYIPAAQETDKTAIIAHGYLGQGMDMDNFARFYSEKLGFNVLLPDARGHGASEGDYIGFGWPDRKDYLLWIQKVIDRSGDQAQIVLHGISMGGATVMMVSGEALPQQVKAIVEDCGYSSVYEEFTYQFQRRFSISGFPFIEAASMLTQLRAGYSFYEASAIKQLTKNQTPTLFIHGMNDSLVPTNMVWQLYKACRAEKEIYLVEGASHGMAYVVNPDLYENVVTNFLSRYVEFDYSTV